jgi:hypothetical protein
MRIFKIKSFTRFCRKEAIEDHQLLKALTGVSQGLAVASLGGEVFKLRVPRKGGGKSGGYRTIVAMRFGHRALFLFGFAKSGQDGLTDEEVSAAKALADEALTANEEQVEMAISDGRWTEVKNDEADV